MESLFVVPGDLAQLAGPTFFNHPFPSDLRRDEAGKVVVAGWPIGRASLLELYIDAIDRQLDGFSPVAAGFLRFSGSLDPTSLPADPGASLLPTSSVQLIDVDPASPEHGLRRPVNVQFRAEEGIYFPSNLLQFAPAVGFPLRPKTRYAGCSVSMARTPIRRSRPSSPSSVRRASPLIVHLAAFTTNDPTEELARAAASLPTQIEAPTVDPAAWKEQGPESEDFVELVGEYGPTPNWQAGTVPYAEYGDGGGFVLDAAGVP